MPQRAETPHGKKTIDLINPTNNEVIGKVTMADEIDTRQAIAAAKKAFASFSQTSTAERMDTLVHGTVLEYGAPQERARSSNALAANIFLHFKEVLKNFELTEVVGSSQVILEPMGVVGIFTPWNSSAGSIAIKVAPAIGNGEIRHKNGATRVGTLRETYGESFAPGVRSDMKLDTLLDRTGARSQSELVKKR